MHPLPDSWTFNGDVEKPTFNPSFRQSGGGAIPKGQSCHYFIHGGQIEFCGDSWHTLAGQTVPMPPLPEGLRD